MPKFGLEKSTGILGAFAVKYLSEKFIKGLKEVTLSISKFRDQNVALFKQVILDMVAMFPIPPNIQRDSTHHQSGSDCHLSSSKMNSGDSQTRSLILHH